MTNPNLPKMPKVVETQNGIYINGHWIPFALQKDDGTSTTEVEPMGDHVKVTISFIARSYSFKKERKNRLRYNFHQRFKLRRFISNLFY